ncbi:MAG: SIMPL domain-containing protein [Zoogloeaceae bacterium]|nr:SIMPL domain-containing protein [Zoogloeaceae bacterium]
MKRKVVPSLLLAALLALSAPAIAEPAKATTIDLSAEAGSKAENDLGRAQLYFEASDKNAQALAGKVNRAIADALETAKPFTSVMTSTAGSTTYPIHDREGNRIEGWRMRSTIELESRDMAALSALIGQLQQTLLISSVNMQPAPETRAKATNVAAVDAIRAFEERAEVLANALGKRYRIRHLSVQHAGSPPAYPMMRASAMSLAKDESAPLQGGQSEITVTVSGTVELTD